MVTGKEGEKPCVQDKLRNHFASAGFGKASGVMEGSELAGWEAVLFSG